MKQLDTLAKRIVWSLKIVKKPHTVVSQKLYGSPSYLGKIIKGEIIEMGFMRGLMFADYAGLDPYWLATGQVRSEIILLKNRKRCAIGENPNSPLLTNYVPLLDWQDAGRGIKSAYDLKDKRAHVALIQMKANSGMGAFALLIDGDSMNDHTNKYTSFQRGDFVFFDPDERPYLDGYVLVMRMGEKYSILRRLQLDSGKVWLVANNRSYPAYELSKGDKIIAVLVERSTRFEQTVNSKSKKVKYLDEIL